MKKFFLYFLLFLFIAGLAILAYGFWNARNIRKWAIAAEEIKARHDSYAREKNIQERLNSGGMKNVDEFKAELDAFVADLISISKECDSARQETEKLNAPQSVKNMREEFLDYWSEGKRNIEDLEKIVEFIRQVFEVAIINDKMRPDMTIEEIAEKISEAKEKSGEINVDILPEDMKTFGNDLKIATENYLEKLDQFAAGKTESHDELNASYDDFSQKLNDFVMAGKSYFISTLRNFDAAEKKIDSDLAVLERIKFSVK